MTTEYCAWAICVAGGRGQRMGLAHNKVFMRLSGREVLAHTLDALASSGLFRGIVLVLGAEDHARYRDMAERLGGFPLVRAVVTGGEQRQQSVYAGLCALPPQCDIVAIHDAARPFVGAQLIRATIESALEVGSGVAATRLTDTVKYVDEAGNALETPARDALRAVQTPQTFRADLIRDAHERAREAGILATDDAALLERLGARVRLVETPDGARNIKLTQPQDIAVAQALLSQGGAREADEGPRVGYGYDVHKLTQGRALVLCGVEIASERGLLGHSDADVAVHALMDALLGAASLGDIGRLFPDSDAQYKGISSMVLLERTMEALRARGLAPVSADVTIVAQRPKLAPYMPAMCVSLAAALRLPAGRVNVKATTSEGLGFEGEGLGISAHAVVLLGAPCR